MNILRWGANVVEGASPAGLIVAGAMLAVAFPPVRKTLRGAAVVATRGVLTAADAASDSMDMMREGLKNMVAEARGPIAGAAAEAEIEAEAPRDGRRIIRGIRRRGRRMAVTAAAGALALREGLHDIVAEARENRESARQQAPTEAESVDLDCHCEAAAPVDAQMREAERIEAHDADVDTDAPSKRTTARRKSKSDL